MCYFPILCRFFIQTYGAAVNQHHRRTVSTASDAGTPIRIGCNHSTMNLNLCNYRWASSGMSRTASNSCALPRACIHCSAFYHDFTGSFLPINTSCSDSGTSTTFCSYISSANPYSFYTFSCRSTDSRSVRNGSCNYSSPLDVNGSCILLSTSSNCCTSPAYTCIIEHLYGARLFRLTVNRKICTARHADAGRWRKILWFINRNLVFPFQIGDHLGRSVYLNRCDSLCRCNRKVIEYEF